MTVHGGKEMENLLKTKHISIMHIHNTESMHTERIISTPSIVFQVLQMEEVYTSNLDHQNAFWSSPTRDP